MPNPKDTNDNKPNWLMGLFLSLIMMIDLGNERATSLAQMVVKITVTIMVITLALLGLQWAVSELIDLFRPVLSLFSSGVTEAASLTGPAEPATDVPIIVTD